MFRVLKGPERHRSDLSIIMIMEVSGVCSWGQVAGGKGEGAKSFLIPGKKFSGSFSGGRKAAPCGASPAFGAAVGRVAWGLRGPRLKARARVCPAGSPPPSQDSAVPKGRAPVPRTRRGRCANPGGLGKCGPAEVGNGTARRACPAVLMILGLGSAVRSDN